MRKNSGNLSDRARDRTAVRAQTRRFRGEPVTVEPKPMHVGRKRGTPNEEHARMTPHHFVVQEVGLKIAGVPLSRRPPTIHHNGFAVDGWAMNSARSILSHRWLSARVLMASPQAS